MLPSGLSWAAFASLVLGVRCANDFVNGTGSRALPAEFGLGQRKPIYWINQQGFIAGIYLHSNGQSDDSADNNWILAPNCPPEDSDNTCTAHDNTGTTEFYVNETVVTLGSGYHLRLLWTNSRTYEDIDDDTEEVESSEFSIIPAEDVQEPSHPGGLGPAEQAGISVAVIVVVIFIILLVWFRWRRVKKRRVRRERSLRNAQQDKEQGSWYERWQAGKPKDAEEKSWIAANLPTEPSPTVAATGAAAAAAAAAGAGAGVRKVSKTGSGGQPYLDDKAEMPTDGVPRHEIDSFGTSAARNKTELDGTSAPRDPAAVELPAEPVAVSGQQTSFSTSSGSPQSRTVSSATSGTTFEYNPNPSYALQPPAGSPPPEAGQVSPVSEGVGTYNSLAGSVSPVTPIARKPVGGTVKTIPEQQQQQQYGDAGRQDLLTPDAADEAPKRGKSAMLRKEKSRIWKMLGGGSTKGKLNPSGSSNV